MQLIYKPVKLLIMKKIKIFGLLVLLLMILSVPKSFAQVEKTVTENYEFSIKLTNQSTGDKYSYKLYGTELIQVNKIGKILRVLTFRLSDNDIMELANPMIMLSISEVTGDFDGNPDDLETLDGRYATITKNGNLRIVYHSVK